MTPFASGIAACTALTTPNTAAPTTSASKTFDPREMDWTRFIPVSFRVEVRAARQSVPQKPPRGQLL